jgi:3-hydroxyisobutyryl-CoA hydrolase
MGGGVGLSVHGAFRVATEKAVFAMPECAIGFFPDVGGSHFLPRLPGQLGRFLALTGYRLTGRDLYKAGVATHFICRARLNELEADLLRIEKPELSTIHMLLTKYQEQWEDDYKKEFSLKPYIGRVNTTFKANSVEEILENLRKEGAYSEWAKQQYETLLKASPLSLKVTYRALQEGAKLSLPDCLKMEYRLSQQFMENSTDFYEGVRAALIDKDRKPKWNPARLEDVTPEMVDKFFQPLDKDFRELQL